MPPIFGHEELTVHQESIAFIVWLEPILDDPPKALSVWSQLERASTAIPLNIAEGNGKFTGPDRGRFFDIARGSSLECAAALDVLAAKGKTTAVVVAPGKERLRGIVAMLVGSIETNSDYRLHDEGIHVRGSGNAAGDWD